MGCFVEAELPYEVRSNTIFETHNMTRSLVQVAQKKLTLKNVTDHIVDVVCKRHELGYNYGVILIPEGLIDFIPEVSFLSSKAAIIASILSLYAPRLYCLLFYRYGPSLLC